MKLSKIKLSDETKMLGICVIALGLTFAYKPIEKVNAEQLKNLVVNKTDYEVCQGETVEFYVQGKTEDRTYDIDNPTLIGEKVEGYEVVGKRKVKFSKTGIYKFYVSFEGAREEITVNVTKPENTTNYTIKCADGVYTNDIVFKSENSENYEIIESVDEQYDIPLEAGTVYLAKDSYITPVVTINNNGECEEVDDKWVTCSNNQISILATRVEAGEYFD